MNRVLTFLFFLIPSFLHANVLKGDQFFKEEQFDLAKAEYQLSAQVGSAHAYYQLGTIFLKGLGSNAPDPFKALIYFSLAAEYEFSDAQDVVTKMLADLPKEKQEVAKGVISDYRKRFGVSVTQANYFPEINQDVLDNLVMFGDSAEPGQVELDDNSFNVSTDFINDFYAENNVGSGGADFYSQDDFGQDDFTQEDLSLDSGFVDENGDSTDDQVLVAPVVTNNTQPGEAYFEIFILDVDIAPDGSLRDLDMLKDTYRVPLQLAPLKQMNVGSPNSGDEKTYMPYRHYNTRALLNRFSVQDRYPRFYALQRRLIKRQRDKTSADDKYKLAMNLIFYPWLESEEGEAEKLLKELAEAHHPRGQYEYGYLLYRQQKDIKQGIYWLEQASKYGVVDAEYRLARILKEGYWVKNDDEKALFWFDKAAQQGNVVAKRKIAEIQLLSKNENLVDIESGYAILNSITEEQEGNPEYQYLQAIAHAKKKERNFRQAVVHLRKAIDLGESFNWDVAKWKTQLAAWTTGRVSVTDIDG